MSRPTLLMAGLSVKSGIVAGAIVCYDNSTGVLMPIWTPCSTPINPPSPAPPTPGVQWLSCSSCAGASLGQGRLQDATCEVCYT